MAFEAIVKVHQTQYYNEPDTNRPPFGIVFDGVTRAKADQDLIHCAKFLINYCFYKFGREVDKLFNLYYSNHREQCLMEQF